MTRAKKARRRENPAVHAWNSWRSHRTPDDQVIALTLLAAAESAHSYSSFLPSHFTIKSFALDGNPEEVTQKVANLRSGYAPAIAFGVVLGGAVSVLSRSPLPLLASVLTSAFMTAMYEQALPPDVRLDPFHAILGSGHSVPGAGDEPGPGLFKSRPGWEMENVLNVS